MPFDPADAALIRDPYPVYQRLRGQPGLHRAAGGYWVATRYADVRHVLTDRTFGQGDFVRNIQQFYPPGFDVLAQSGYRWLSEVFVMQDPPQHTRLRKLVSYALTPKRVAEMQSSIEAITHGLIERLQELRQFDLITEFAYQLPTLVMCDMLGIEQEERTPERMAGLTRAIAESFLVFETRALTPAELATANRQMDYLYDYFGALFERRRRRPGDDMTSALAVACDEEGGLSPRERVTVVIAMFGAGFETTAHLIGNGLYTLHRFPQAWDALVAEPALAPAVVEEVLRFESSLQATYRTALADTAVNGYPVRAGEKVLCIVAAANRDPEVFADPERFDPRRGDTRGLSFGGGIHHCIGNQLARLEGRVAFDAFARRLPGLRVKTEQPPWRPGFLFRGLQELPATL
ncbi:MAG: cytochrome P450 [Nevskia sp.]|nr:cytochrome P450 [Nevskia sp.]